MIMLVVIFNIIAAWLPLYIIVGHFLSSFVTYIVATLFVTVYLLVPKWPDIIVHVLYLIGIPFAFMDFPLPFFVFYMLMLVVYFGRTILRLRKPKDFREEMAKDNEDF